jgi:peptidoglycan/LPS O-acetylase OafA/YrhL
MEWILRLRGVQLLPLVAAAVLVIVFTRSPSAVLGVISDGLRDWVAPWRERFPVVMTIRALVAWAGMMAFGCLSFLLHRGRPARLAQLFSLPAVTWLGRISFSVYLWQNIFCFGVTRTWADRFPLSLLASVGCGYLTYRFVELSSLRWRSRLKRPGNPAEIQPGKSGGTD